MDNLCCLSPEQVTMFATALAIQLAEGREQEEIFMLRNIASQVSSTLYTLYTQKQYLSKNCTEHGEKQNRAGRSPAPDGSKTIPGNG